MPSGTSPRTKLSFPYQWTVFFTDRTSVNKHRLAHCQCANEWFSEHQTGNDRCHQGLAPARPRSLLQMNTTWHNFSEGPRSAWSILRAFGMLLAFSAAQGAVVITSVKPNRGSLAGGTRLHIQVRMPCTAKGRNHELYLIEASLGYIM